MTSTLLEREIFLDNNNVCSHFVVVAELLETFLVFNLFRKSIFVYFLHAKQCRSHGDFEADVTVYIISNPPADRKAAVAPEKFQWVN